METALFHFYLKNFKYFHVLRRQNLIFLLILFYPFCLPEFQKYNKIKFYI